MAKDIDVNWKTVENHLTYLVGRRLVHEVFSSKYVRIFEITEFGQRYLLNTRSREEPVLDLDLSEEVGQ